MIIPLLIFTFIVTIFPSGDIVHVVIVLVLILPISSVAIVYCNSRVIMFARVVMPSRSGVGAAHCGNYITINVKKD
jgi:hypothetical protein